jgi:hypothetical protein
MIDTANPTDPDYGQYTLPFGQIGSVTTVTISPAYATFATTLDPATCGTGTSAVVTVVQQSATAFTVTSNVAGICKATITSPSAVSTTLWFTVNQTGFTVQ